MAITVLAGTRSPRGIPSSLVEGRGVAQADTFGDIAGTTRWLSEYVNGSTATATYGSPPQVAPPTPLHGNDLPGHDHSGGFMGVPQKHTIWSTTYGWKLSNDTVSNNVAPRLQLSATGDGKLIDCIIGPVWCPPGSIYVRGVRVIFGLLVETDNADVTVEMIGADGTVATTSSTYAPGTRWIEPADLIHLNPGGFCFPHIKVDVTAQSTGTTSLFYVGINQVLNEPNPSWT